MQLDDQQKKEIKSLEALHRCTSEIINQRIYNLTTQKNKVRKLNILDIGCGFGLSSKFISKKNTIITGIDEDRQKIFYANKYQKNSNIKYKCIDFDRFVDNLNSRKDSQKYDIVVALEIIEHIEDKKSFFKKCISITENGGFIYISTITKTYKSFLISKMFGEFILQKIPFFTHDWGMFIKPSRLDKIATDVSSGSLKLISVNPIEVDPISMNCHISSKTKNNYIAEFQKSN